MRIKNITKTLLSKLHRHHKTDPDIFIFTLPRAGSTLLAEILNSNPHSKLASESFAINEDNVLVLNNYFKNDFISERYVDISDTDFQQVIHYYNDLSKGKTWNSYYWSDFFTSHHRFNTKRTIFKTHKFTYYYGEIMNHFKNDFGVYLLRNPISHSLSRINKGWNSYIDLYADSNKIKKTLSEKAINKINQVSQNGTTLEKFIVSWCLENYIFIHTYQNQKLPSNIIPVFYEDLILDTENSIKNICNKVNMDYNKEMLTILDIPSSGIVHSTKETESQIKSGNKNYLVNRWKEKVDSNSLIRIKEILLSFDINLYVDSFKLN